MEELFYKLEAEPFRLSPDHRFCYDHKSYARARAYLTYAFMRAEGFVMITGRPGTGKTTLVGELIESLSDKNVKTANLVCTQLQADDLLKVTAYDFGIDHRIVEKGELLQHLGLLLRRWHREGSRALLIVDEAQELSDSAMKELRLLTNIQEGGKPLLQIFLLGQPELRELVLSPALEPVHQRIVAASHLDVLEVNETEAYIIHRLNKVGWKGDPALSKAIYPLIHKFSEGIPRRINLICSRLFLHGTVEQLHRIGVAELREVIEELQAENLAAGTHFSGEDFEVEDEYEPHGEEAATPPSSENASPTDSATGEAPQVASPQLSEPSGAGENEHLHAVGDDVEFDFDSAAASRASDPENNDLPTLPQTAQEPHSPTQTPAAEPARQEKQAPPEAAEHGPSQQAAGAGEQNSGKTRSRRGLMGLVVLGVVILSLSLWAWLAHA